MATKVKAETNRANVAATCYEILRDCESDPADKIIALGTALVKIGEALRGTDTFEACRVLRSAAALHGIEL
jgi:hypothetical protein